MQWFMTALQKWADFSSRARRREYWFFVLIYIVIYIVLTVIDMMVGLADPATGVGVLGGIFALAMLIPSISVGVRRLHDTNRSGWWLLIGLIPIIGALVLLVFFLLDSQPGDNRFGPNPKAAG
jgi:uncharacterized membrane protein YhaH (DUF805 family)